MSRIISHTILGRKEEIRKRHFMMFSLCENFLLQHSLRAVIETSGVKNGQYGKMNKIIKSVFIKVILFTSQSDFYSICGKIGNKSADHKTYADFFRCTDYHAKGRNYYT